LIEINGTSQGTRNNSGDKICVVASPGISSQYDKGINCPIDNYQSKGRRVRTDDFPDVRRLPLFSGMDDTTFAGLMRGAYLQNFPARVQLISEGDPADFLFVMVDGRAELYASWAGRETTMDMVGPEGTFILAAVLKEASHLMSARTFEKSRILMIPAGDVRAAFERDDTFARALVIELARCYRVMVKSQKNLKLRSGVERLAACLLKLNRAQGETGTVALPVDKRTLAALLGMTPENLSRAFGTLKPYGVLVQGAAVTLSDVPGLETLAKPTPLIDDETE